MEDERVPKFGALGSANDLMAGHEEENISTFKLPHVAPYRDGGRFTELSLPAIEPAVYGMLRSRAKNLDAHDFFSPVYRYPSH